MRRMKWLRLVLILLAVAVTLVAIVVSVRPPWRGQEAQKRQEAEQSIGTYVGYDVSCTRLGTKDGFDIWRCRGGGKDECWATRDAMSWLNQRHPAQPDETLPGCPVEAAPKPVRTAPVRTAPQEVAVPDGEILFTRLSAPESKRSSLFRVAADGSGLRLFVRDAAEAAVSPDGRRLAFARGDAIWLMGRDGSQQEQLTRPPAGIADSEPAWSADGRTIFYTRERVGSWSIFSVRTDGTRQRRLTAGAARWWNMGGQSGAAPSPRGSIVAYTDYGYGGGDESESIEAMTVAGRTTKLGFSLYSSADVEYTFDPAWAPDSRRLAFGLLDLEAVNEEDRVGQSGVYVSTSTTAAPRRIARPSRVSERLLEPAWSADGQWVAFEARAEVEAGYRSRIWLVHDDGTSLRRVTAGKADSDAVWLPPTS